MTRDGRKRETLILEDVKPPILEDYQGLGALDQTISDEHTLSPEKIAKQLDTKPRNSAQKQEQFISTQLSLLEQSLKEAGTEKKEPEGLPSVAEKIEKPPPRPPTPTVERP
jgi:hypothetical protein